VQPWGLIMIKSFKHKGLREFFINNRTKLLQANHVERISRLLDRLDASRLIQDMDLPGFDLHQLHGQRKNTWSVKVSGNWRITFKFSDEEAIDVNLEDYH
jgi:proteic killer suppression protein